MPFLNPLKRNGEKTLSFTVSNIAMMVKLTMDIRPLILMKEALAFHKINSKPNQQLMCIESTTSIIS